METRMAKSVKEIYEGLNIHVSFLDEDIAAVFAFFGFPIPPSPEAGALLAEALYNQMLIEKKKGMTFKKLKKEVTRLRGKHG
jgi:hypothetical protein